MARCRIRASRTPSRSASTGPTGSRDPLAPIFPSVVTAPVSGLVSTVTRGVTVSVVGAPPRTIATGSGTPACGSSTPTRSRHWAMALPPIDTTLSPASSPAFSAGEPFSTEPITGAVLGMPDEMRSAVMTTIASRKFIVTPASITTSLAHSGFDSNQRSDGTGFGPKGTNAAGSHGMPGSPFGFAASSSSVPRPPPPSNAAIASSSRDAMRT